ncbi:MAG: GGDEF domain-containing protein [Butyrivibrio sp.]|nr:GGDEF domain-containing protein [Butyrivibrio sp.]
MKDVSFYEIIISKSDQKIISADAHVYDALAGFVTRPMNELIAVEDIDIYQNNIKNCDGNWYPSKILSPDTMYYCYVKAQRCNDKLIRLTVVNAKDLLNAHSGLMKAISAANAQLGLYEDVFFEYSPALDIITVYNTELAEFENGDYSLADFEEMLLAKADNEDKKTAIKSFIAQIRSGVGRSGTIVEGNILNNDTTVTHTALVESFVFYDKDTEGVVGHIQLRRNGDSLKPNSIRHDSLTGLVDKTDIIKIARERIDDRRLEGTALVIIDVDFFKNINDTYGHQFGDDVIKKVADIISGEVGKNGIAGRFGGDEFFVVLYNIQSEEQLRSIIRGIKNKVSATFPDKGKEKDSPLSVSIGASVFSKDADNYDDLFTIADHCLYLAKEKGRNRYVIYTLEKHGTLEDIILSHQTSKKISDRDFSYGDVIVKLFDMALHDKDSTVEEYINDFAEAFALQNVNLYVGSPSIHRYSAGDRVIKDQTAIDFVLSNLNSDARDKYFSLGNFVVINHLEMLPPHARNIKDFLTKREVFSLIIIRFYDKDKRECILIISSVGKKVQWNQSHFKYYRAFTDVLSLLSLR